MQCRRRRNTVIVLHIITYLQIKIIECLNKAFKKINRCLIYIQNNSRNLKCKQSNTIDFLATIPCACTDFYQIKLYILSWTNLYNNFLFHSSFSFINAHRLYLEMLSQSHLLVFHNFMLYFHMYTSIYLKVYLIYTVSSMFRPGVVQRIFKFVFNLNYEFVKYCL